MEQEIASQIVGLGGASDFTLWVFLYADFVVKFGNNSINLVQYFLGINI